MTNTYVYIFNLFTELVNTGEYWDSNIINKKLNGVYDTVHTVR